MLKVQANTHRLCFYCPTRQQNVKIMSIKLWQTLRSLVGSVLENVWEFDRHLTREAETLSKTGKCFGFILHLNIRNPSLALTFAYQCTHTCAYTCNESKLPIIFLLLSRGTVGADLAYFWQSALLTMLLWKWRRPGKVNLHRKLPSR